MINVLLDISVLGAVTNESRRGKGITGIFRVVERLADGLAHASECALTVCAAQHQAHSREHFERELRPLGVRFAGSQLPAPIQPLASALLATEKFCAEYFVRHGGRHFPVVGRAAWAACRWLFREADRGAAQTAEIYHASASSIPAWVRRHRHLQVFSTVYDLIPILHPEFFLPQPIRHARWLCESFTPEDWALCISESTRRDLLAHSRCDPARALVLPLAAEAHFHPVDDPEVIATAKGRYGIPLEAPYFLSVCTLEPRKNLDGIIRAFVAAAQERRIGPATRLVLVGDLGWMTEKLLAAHAGSGDLRERIIFTGFVAEGDLAALYAGARAFIYMSLYEGFGLPPLEAMQCGTPVVTSDNSSLPEVIGKAGIMLDARDCDALAETLGRLDENPELRAQMSARSRARAAEFSWERFIAGTLAAYRLALKR